MKRVSSLPLACVAIFMLFASCGTRIVPWQNGTYEGELVDGQPDGYGLISWRQAQNAVRCYMSDNGLSTSISPQPLT